MPWVRIDENAMDHPKFLALSDGAWRLWCEGLAYCQKHLTDGLIQVAALRGFRHFSPGKMKVLLQPYQPGANPLWSQPDPKTVMVHDYLQWNDSREEVLSARQGAQERRQRYRDKRVSSMDASGDASRTPSATPNVPRGVGGRDGFQVIESAERFPRTPDSPDPGLPQRAGDFVERYQDMHLQFRGVAYIGNPRKDFEEALLLVRAHDDTTLDQLATVFLNADDEFARNGTATVSKFRSRASWCNERLQAELRRRGIA
jgi:hypothetical protein